MDWKSTVQQVLARRGRLPSSGTAADLALQDMIDEWAQHAALAFEAARAEGRTTAEATAVVTALIEDWASGVQGPPRRRSAPLAVAPPQASSSGWAGWWMDVVYALRLLRTQPGFTAVALLTIALAVGATTTLFSVADGVLGKPLPYPQPDRLVRLEETREGATRELRNLITHVTYHRWRDAPTTMEAITGFRTSTMAVGEAGAVQRLRGIRATASYFTVLGLTPVRGTFFSERDEVQGAAPVVVITERLWRDRFGGADDVIGRTLDLDARAHTVVAVMRDRELFPDPEWQFVTPMFVPPVATDPAQGGSVSLFGALARLAPGATLDQALAEATTRARTGPPAQMVDMALWGSQGLRVVKGVSLIDSMTGEVRPAILVFLGAVALLFLTAVANISSLQLARAAARRREFAIRAAIGAGTGRLTRQLLVESGVLGLAGGVLGVGVALALHQALPSLLPADFPRAADVAIDMRTLAFAFGASVLASFVCGVLPAWQVRRLRLVDALQEDGQAPVGVSARTSVGRFRLAIMVGQVAIAAMLLVGAGVLGRTFTALWNVDRGYEPEHMLTMRLPMPDYAFTEIQRRDVAQALAMRVRTLGGVTAAGFATVLPISNTEALMAFTFRRPSDGQTINAEASSRTVSDGYFEALGATLAAGRTFRETDTQGAPQVIVVNQTFARTYLDGQGVGTMVPVSSIPGRTESEVVGIITDIQPQVRGEAPRPEVYFAAAQDPEGLGFPEPSLVVRTSADPLALVADLRRLAPTVDDRLVLDAVMTMEERLRTGLARPRLYAVLLTSLSALALLIAGVGVFGVLSYNVAQRRREIGVRAALGARPVDLVRMTMAQGLWITGVGLVLGLGTAAYLVRFLRDLVWGVEPLDGVSFALVPAVLLVVAALACWWPARRASRIDPLTALRPR
jgi:putative ABC transport system permease protein